MTLIDLEKPFSGFYDPPVFSTPGGNKLITFEVRNSVVSEETRMMGLWDGRRISLIHLAFLTHNIGAWQTATAWPRNCSSCTGCRSSTGSLTNYVL